MRPVTIDSQIMYHSWIEPSEADDTSGLLQNKLELSRYYQILRHGKTTLTSNSFQETVLLSCELLLTDKWKNAHYMFGQLEIEDWTNICDRIWLRVTHVLQVSQSKKSWII